MTDFLKDVERGVKNTPVANEGKNNRDREAAARKQADREGDIAGKARSDADHARSSREREKHLGDELSRIRRDASTEGDLFGRTFAKAWSKAFKDEVRKTTGKGLNVQRILADDLKIKQGKAANTTNAAKNRATGREQIKAQEDRNDQARRAAARAARRADSRAARQERYADEDVRAQKKKTTRTREANDFAEKVAGREKELREALKPAGKRAAKALRGYEAKVEDEIAGAGKLTETTERRAKAWSKAARTQDKLVREAAVAWTSVKKADHAVRQTIRGLAEAEVKGDSAKLSKAQAAFDRTSDAAAASRKRATETQAALVQARKDADKLRDQFRQSVSTKDIDKKAMAKARRDTEAAMRAQMGLVPADGDPNENLRKISQRENALRTKSNGKNRRLSGADYYAINRAKQAAADLDVLEQEAKLLEDRVKTANERVAAASLTKYQVDNDATSSITRRTAAERELKAAILDRDKADTSLKRNVSRTAVARTRYSEASGGLDRRERSNPFLRLTERLDAGTGNWLEELNSKLIYAGRYLSSIGQIATTSAAALAAMGAVNLLPLISSAAQAASALATLPAIITAAGAGIAALAVGGSGIIGAFKAAKDAGESAADVANKQQDAAEKVADTYDSLADARENADRTAVSGARQIASAEKSVQSALDRTKTAQENLNKARENAAEKIRDLNDALRDNSLDERSAALSALKAGQNVIKTAADPNASWIDIAQAQIDAEQASFNLEEVQKNNKKEVDAAAKANKDGIEGDEDVIAARKALVDANGSLVESQQRLKDVAESVAQANEDANKRAERAARNYQNALDDQKRILEKLGNSGLGEQFEKVYKKLSPNAKDLVDQIRALGPEWTQLRKTSQDALTNGLGKAIADVSRKQLPTLSLGLAAINSEINGGIKNSLKVFSEPKSINDFNTFLSNTSGMFRGLSSAATPLTKIFVDLTTAGSAVLPSLGQAINTVATRWSEKIDLKRQTGELNYSINQGIEKMQQLGQVVGNTFGGVRGFFAALRGEGDSMMGSLVQSTARFEEWTKSAEGAAKIQSVFGRVSEILADIRRLVGGIAGLFNALFGDAIQTMGGQTLKVLADVANAFATLATAVMSVTGLGDGLNALLTVLVGFFALRTLTGVFQNLGRTIVGFVKTTEDSSQRVNGLPAADADADGSRDGKKKKKKKGKKNKDDAEGAGGEPGSVLDLALESEAEDSDDKKKTSAEAGSAGGAADGGDDSASSPTADQNDRKKRTPRTPRKSGPSQTQQAQRRRRGRAVRRGQLPKKFEPVTFIPTDSAAGRADEFDTSDIVTGVQGTDGQTPRGGTGTAQPNPAAAQAKADLDSTSGAAKTASESVSRQASTASQAINQQAAAASEATRKQAEGASQAAESQGKRSSKAVQNQADAASRTGRRQAAETAATGRREGASLGSAMGSAARDTANAATNAARSARSGLSGLLSDFKRVWSESHTAAQNSFDRTTNGYDTFQRGVLTRATAMRDTVGRSFDALPGRAASALSSVRSGLSGVVETLGGPWTLAFTAAAAGFSYFTGKLDELNQKEADFKQSIKDHAEFRKTYATDIKSALNNSDGLVDDGVRGTQLGAVKDFRAEIDDQIKGKYSNSDQFWDNLRPSHWIEKQEDYQKRQQFYRDRNKSAKENEDIKGVLDDYSDTEINDAILGTQSRFNEFVAGLKHDGDTDQAVKNATDRLSKLRKEFLDNQSAASRLKDTIDKLRDGNLEASDAVAKLAGELAKQRGNTNIFQNSRAGAFAALDNLKGLQFEDSGGASYTGGNLVNEESANGRALLEAIQAAQTGLDTMASSEIVQALNADPTRNVEAAINTAEAKTRTLLAGYQAQIGAKTGITDETQLNALLAAYGLDDASLRNLLTAKAGNAAAQNNPLGVPGGLPAVAAPAVGTVPNGQQQPANGQVAPAVDPKTGQPAPAVDPKASQPAAQQQPDLAPTTKAYNELLDVVNKLKTSFGDVATEMGKVAKGLDDTKTATENAKPKVDDLSGAIATLQTKFTEHLGETGALKAWQGLVTGIDGHVKNLTDTILPTLTKAVGDMETKFSSAPTNITTSFAGVKKAVADPISWIITTAFVALKNAWNSVRTVLPSLPQWDAELTGISGGYWTGGIIPGYTPNRDTTTIAVGGGEAIMRPEFTRAVGSDWIHGMNAAARAGGVPAVQAQMAGTTFGGAFATGGIVGSMESAIKERFPGMQLTSGYRNEPGSFHSTGQAGDFSDGTTDTPAMQKLAAWIASNFLTSTRELIHSPFNHNIDDFTDVGDGMARFGADTMAQHVSHVHWALEKALGDVSGSVMPTGDGSALTAATGKIQELLLQPMEKVKAQMPKLGNSGIEQIAGAAFSTVMDAVSSAVGKSQDAGVTPFDISAGVEQWRPNVIAALEREGFTADERNIRLTLAQIQSESSGNPNIIQQIKDVNSGGNEGVGLLQLIPGTFAAYRNPSLPNDRTNPDANISAALRYYRARYGDDLGAQWGQGHGYDQGGWLPHMGWGWNMSGKPEPVFTNDQWQTMVSQLNALAGSVTGLEGYTTPTGPASFVEMLSKVIGAAAKALKKSAKLITKQQGKPKQTDPSQSKDTSGASASNGGSGASGKANETGTGAGTPATVDADQGLVTGELENGETPTGDSNGDIQPENPDPNATTPVLNADGTTTDENGNTEQPATDTPATTEAPAKSADQLAAEAYQKAAETTRDPAHYQAIWSKAGSSATKAIWDQFTSDLGISGSGFLSQAYSAATDSDNQLNQVINYELGNRVPGYKDARAALANPGAAITTAAQQASANAQTAVQNAQKVVEEHIHYHVTNIDEALRKNALRQQQKAAGFMTR
ncbi:hypothetical protein AWN90_36600 [Nocardia terpenica]|uniref:Transglycosylase SLT domain-containing protein n=2 Tax=Nocardia terpenica TaxID=455432 RepID=A0A164LAT5_9NOCA|nr:hypothetical protein AWN90_36600 [Nocardia terpenica]